MGHTAHQAEPRGPGDTLDLGSTSNWRDLTVKTLLVKRFMLYFVFNETFKWKNH